MPKASRGIYRRPRKDGTVAWVVKVYDPATKKGRWLPTCDSLEEAEDAKRAAQSLPRARRRTTVAEYAKQWLRRPRDKATARTYKHGIQPFLREFGERRLDGFDRVEAQEFATRWGSWVTDPVRTMLNDAIDDGLLVINPFSGLRRPRSRGRKDLEVIPTDELERLADLAVEVHGPDYGRIFGSKILFAAHSGMRPAEIFAAGWDWIDLEADEIAVHGQVDRWGTFKRPKNKLPRLIVLLPQAKEALMAMPRLLRTDHLFTTKRGKPFSQPKLHYYWDPVRRAAGRPEMDFYELRHYCATLLLEQGISCADVAVQLGHTDGGRKVAELYGHPSEERARDRIRAAFRARTVPIRSLRSVGSMSQQGGQSG